MTALEELYLSPVVGTAKAALLTGFSERQIRRWCADKKLEGAHQPGKFHGKWLIPLRELEKKFPHLKDP